MKKKQHVTYLYIYLNLKEKLKQGLRQVFPRFKLINLHSSMQQRHLVFKLRRC